MKQHPDPWMEEVIMKLGWLKQRYWESRKQNNPKLQEQRFLEFEELYMKFCAPTISNVGIVVVI